LYSTAQCRWISACQGAATEEAKEKTEKESAELCLFIPDNTA
jgi:hypothetical protein